jgi:SAM-dependent methyltransferase
MDLTSIQRSIKVMIPDVLRPPLRRLKRFLTIPPSERSKRMQNELNIFSAAENIHQLPSISSYWFEKHIAPTLSPFGFRNSIEFFRTYIARICRLDPSEACRILTIAAGECAPEINIAEWLRENSIHNFRFDCIDINPNVLDRAEKAAKSKGFLTEFEFRCADLSSWEPVRDYNIILAIQCLHHFSDLENIFARLRKALHPNGYFLTDDMIGRNGHQRWPEAKAHVQAFWQELPERYKYNHAFKTQDVLYEDRDFSKDSFEGIRSQDILKLLKASFHFEFFFGFANVIDVFVDRMYGPNFDPAVEWDRDFIDRVHDLDFQEIDCGHIKPTHMYAAMTKDSASPTKFYRHWSPDFCIRPTASGPRER